MNSWLNHIRCLSNVLEDMWSTVLLYALPLIVGGLTLLVLTIIASSPFILDQLPHERIVFDRRGAASVKNRSIISVPTENIHFLITIIFNECSNWATMFLITPHIRRWCSYYRQSQRYIRNAERAPICVIKMCLYNLMKMELKPWGTKKHQKF